VLSAAKPSPQIVCCVLCAELHETAIATINGRGPAQACSPMRRARKAELMAYALGRSPGASSSVPGLLLDVEQQQLVRRSAGVCYLHAILALPTGLASKPFCGFVRFEYSKCSGGACVAVLLCYAAMNAVEMGCFPSCVVAL
jgi:hypothetical protein